MRRSTEFILWAIVALLSTGSIMVLAGPAEARIGHLEGGYAVQLPPGTIIAQTSTVPDFALYKLTDASGKQLLSIYLGNFPEKSISPSSGSNSSTVVGGFKATSRRWSGKDGKSNGMTLIELAHGSGPTYAQFVFNDLSGSDLGVAERVVRSFRQEQSATVK